MIDLKRIDDFRCHDQCLVRIIPGREIEAVGVALELQSKGFQIGLFVQGEDVKDWGFLNQASTLSRFEFVDFSRTLSSENLSSIRDAKFLRVVGRKLAINFSDFKKLETLYYQWSHDASGLDELSSLRNTYLYEIGSPRKSGFLPVPDGVEDLLIVRYGADQIIFPNKMNNLIEFSVVYARSLKSLPEMNSLKRVNLKNVGRDGFCYESIPKGVEEIIIDACAPISDWDFLLEMEGLRRIVVFKTQCSSPSIAAARLLKSVEVVDLPRDVLVD